MPDFSDLVNGGAALTALYFATQINATLAAVKDMLRALQAEVTDLRSRVTLLENPRSRRNDKKARRASPPRASSRS